jgi:hypothetical protein
MTQPGPDVALDLAALTQHGQERVLLEVEVQALVRLLVSLRWALAQRDMPVSLRTPVAAFVQAAWTRLAQIDPRLVEQGEGGAREAGGTPRDRCPGQACP